MEANAPSPVLSGVGTTHPVAAVRQTLSDQLTDLKSKLAAAEDLATGAIASRKRLRAEVDQVERSLLHLDRVMHPGHRLPAGSPVGDALVAEPKGKHG
jgi:hypothetical protein